MKVQEALKASIAWLEEMYGEEERKQALALCKTALSELDKCEPFGYFKAEPFGWTDCAGTDEGAIALYEAPISKEWVGLSEAQENELSDLAYEKGYGDIELIRSAEAKLKQLNAPSYEQNNIPDEYEISVDTGDGIYHATEVVNFQQIGSKRIIQTIKL